VGKVWVGTAVREMQRLRGLSEGQNLLVAAGRAQGEEKRGTDFVLFEKTVRAEGAATWRGRNQV